MIDQAESRVKVIDEDLKTKKNTIGNMKSTLQKTEKELATSQSDLGKAYEELKEKNEKLQIANEKLEKSIEDLKVKDDFIGKEAMGIVCCGTKKFLRQKDILSSTTMKLTKNFKASAQSVGSKINYYESNTLDCGSGNITNVLPERSPSSYKIEGSKLIVKNTEEFWKTDKIVVLVKDK
jgi:regulator of replication initiation timing